MKHSLICTALALTLSVSTHAGAPINTFLADSVWPMTHGNSAQSNEVAVGSTRVASKVLSADEKEYVHIGPFGLSPDISGPYPDGRRVIWNSGTAGIVKVDYESFKLIDKVINEGATDWTAEQADEWIAIQDDIEANWYGVLKSVQLSFDVYEGMASVYSLVDSNNDFLVGGGRVITRFGDEQEGNADSRIVTKAAFEVPGNIPGDIIGINMSYDGKIVTTTTMGYVLVIDPDFKHVESVMLKHAEGADAKASSESAFVRNSSALDQDGGIYVASNGYMNKVVWNGKTLSTNSEQGAWVAEYRNSSGAGSGSTPGLMGFGEDDRFVVITDGDDLMNVTLFWRDQIPEGWQSLKGAPSKRIAGFQPIRFKPTDTHVQSEQSVVIGGNGVFVVNNEPEMYNGLPRTLKLMVIGALNGKVGNQPHGAIKVEWNAETRKLQEVWNNTDVTSTNGVPFIDTKSGIAYTVGARNNQVTVEGLNWATGETEFTYVVGGERYNIAYALMTPDEDGRLMWGTLWGMARVNPQAR